MDDSATIEMINASSYLYGYGVTTGLLLATTVVMLVLAAHSHFVKKNGYARTLFLYCAVYHFILIAFDIFCISIYLPALAQRFPCWLISVGKCIMPIAIFLSYSMFVKSIPIKTVDSFFFWERIKALYPHVTVFLVICFFVLMAINDPFICFVISVVLIAIICFVEYFIAKKTVGIDLFRRAKGIMQLNTNKGIEVYHRVQSIIIFLVVSFLVVIIGFYLTGTSQEDYPNIWLTSRLIIGMLMMFFPVILTGFILQEGMYSEHYTKVSGEGFFKEIYKAKKHHHFFIEYQPKIYLDSKEISGAEALVRWQHPKHGFIPPNEFIPLAEKSDLIDEICKWVIERVVRDIKDMEFLNIRLPISINFSVNNLHTKMVSFLLETLDKYKVSTDMVIVEITETMFLDMNEEQKTALKNLRDANIRLSMDDFGAGHSSFAYFDEIGLNELKLDRKIASNVLLPSKGNVISTIISLCHSLDIKVVAEGVEDEEGVQEKLLELNCDFAQGYGICRPKRIGDFMDWVRFEHKLPSDLTDKSTNDTSAV